MVCIFNALDYIRYFCKHLWSANCQTFGISKSTVYGNDSFITFLMIMWEVTFNFFFVSCIARSWGKARQFKDWCDENLSVCDFACVYTCSLTWSFFCGWTLNESYTYKNYKTCWRSDLETSDIIFSLHTIKEQGPAIINIR